MKDGVCMKYMGSKARIAKDIVPIIQDYIDKNNISLYLAPCIGIVCVL